MAIYQNTRVPYATLQTTNATPTTVTLLDLSAPGFSEAINGQGLYVELIWIAQSTGNAVSSGKVAATLKRISGTLSLLGSVTTIHSAVTDLAASATIAVSGNIIQASATGIALTTINWKFHLTPSSN